MKKIQLLILTLVSSAALSAQNLVSVSPSHGLPDSVALQIMITGNNTGFMAGNSYPVQFNSGIDSFYGTNTIASAATTLYTTIYIPRSAPYGLYNVIVTGSTGGPLTLDSGFAIGPWAAGISSVDAGELSIYPNPVSGLLYIQPSPGQAIARIDIATLSGQAILEQTATGSSTEQVNMADVPAGMYILALTDRTGAVRYEKIAVR